jgi:choice-of-anchor A domain-containing protein
MMKRVIFTLTNGLILGLMTQNCSNGNLLNPLAGSKARTVKGASLLDEGDMTAMGKAQCAVLNEQMVPFNFNTLVFGDLNVNSSDVEGRLGVGGNAAITDYLIGDSLTADNSRVDLVVAHSLNIVRGNVAKGAAVYGDNLTNDKASFAGGITKNSSFFDFAAAQTKAAQLSERLGSLPEEGTVTAKADDKALVLEGKSPGVNVFRVSADQLNDANVLDIQAPETATAIINIVGETVKIDGKTIKLAGGIKGQKIIYNFPLTSSLELANIGLEGGILAPIADVKFETGLLKGYLVAKSLVGKGQIGNIPFDGCIPNGGKDYVDPKPDDEDGEQDDKDGKDVTPPTDKVVVPPPQIQNPGQNGGQNQQYQNQNQWQNQGQYQDQNQWQKQGQYQDQNQWQKQGQYQQNSSYQTSGSWEVKREYNVQGQYEFGFKWGVN